MRNIALMLAAALLAAGTSVPAHEADKQSPAKKEISTERHPWGTQGDPRNAVRTIAIDMADTMRFTPAQVTVRQGDTVKFVVRNTGKVVHEMVIGTQSELQRHAELMKKHPGMEHDEPYMAHVNPGSKEEIAWTFTEAGTFMYGCLIPGHWEAGMQGSIVVGSAAVAASALTEAEVRKVDKDAKKITLKHQEIKHLDMPAMTMVFLVKDEAMLDRVKKGDRVRFTAEKMGGAYTITAIEEAK
jgi:uncharacterized cupredoxin-like copper-binding protein